MHSFTVFSVAAIAALASAQGGDSDSDSCTALSGDAQVACNLSVEGFNAAAASYLETVQSVTALDDAFSIIADAPAFSTATGVADNAAALFSDYLPQASLLSDSSERALFTSIVGQVLALNNGASGAAPSATASAGSSASAASGSGPASTMAKSTGSPSAGVSGAPASSGASASVTAASMSSHGAAPRQTGVYAAVGLVAGVAGLALGL